MMTCDVTWVEPMKVSGIMIGSGGGGGAYLPPCMKIRLSESSYLLERGQGARGSPIILHY